MDQLRQSSRNSRGFVEIHSYGDLGSTYDRQNGGRPLRRSEAAVVLSTPWATQRPVGLARLLPGDLRGTPKVLERILDLELEKQGFKLGPSPYPIQGPWAISTRFLAACWFRWLAEKGHLPQETAEHMAMLAWVNEHDSEAEAVATGKVPEHGKFRGIRDLAVKMGEWSHAASNLGEVFQEEGQEFHLGRWNEVWFSTQSRTIRSCHCWGVAQVQCEICEYGMSMHELEMVFCSCPCLFVSENDAKKDVSAL